MMKIFRGMGLVACVMLLVACGSKKALVTDGKTTVTDGVSGATSQSTANEAAKVDAAQQTELQKMNFLHKVVANASTSPCVASKISLEIQSGSKDISVPGLIRMKKDDVIRLHVQIPLLGSEVGRLEFTNDYVLVVDRLHKQYFKADYTKADFLNRYGLTFHSLQALFWNELTVPGYSQLTDEALRQLDVTFGDAQTTTISLKKGNMAYEWHADNKSGRLTDVTVTYGTKPSDTTRLNVVYDDFRTLERQPFPASLAIGMNTNAIKGKTKNMNLNIQMNQPTNNGDWETRTDVSKKYKEVSAEDVLKILTSF